MAEWDEAVQFAIKRSAKSDNGAQAALQGILGLPLAETGETAARCFHAAHTARQKQQRALERRRKPPLAPGTTGKPDWDHQLVAHQRQSVVA